MNNDYRPRVLDFVKRWGPILPVQISKELNTNIIFAGAMLSELVAKNLVLVTSTKRGGSPFYYVKGQEARLQGIASNLSGKEKEAYEVLKEKKVIKDKEASPWLRVAIRSISDFAVQLNVTMGGQQEIFWKWYLLDEKKTEEIIKNMLDVVEVGGGVQENIEEQKTKETTQQTQLQQQVLEGVLEPSLHKEADLEPKLEKPKKKRKVQSSLKGHDIEILALEYFNDRAIKLIEKQTIRKSKDSRFIVEVPSGIGNISYYVRAKIKASISEDDLMVAFGEAKQRGLPGLFISTGELSKKAKEILETNLKGQLMFFRI